MINIEEQDYKYINLIPASNPLPERVHTFPFETSFSKVEKTGEIYKVFKVISDNKYLNNSFILDHACISNNFICPNAETIKNKINDDFDNDDFISIDSYTHTEGKVYLKLISLDRESKLKKIL